MSAWLAAQAARFGAWASAIAAGIAAMGVLMWSQRRAGRRDARAEAREQDLRNRETRDAVERDVGRGAGGDAADRLRERWRRD